MSSEQNNISPFLPFEPFDGQIFYDYYGVKWVYSADDNYWVSNGKTEKIPVANSTTTGLLPKNQKTILDQIPPKGGGYAIVLRPVQMIKTRENPDSLLHGQILLESQSLDIECTSAGQDTTVANPANCSNTAVLLENIENPPGFDFNFSDNFLKSFCVVVPGGPGPKGPPGDVGDPGADGTGDGPPGDQGPAGQDATYLGTFTGIQVIESSDIYNTAVVDMSLDNGQLILKYGQIAAPTAAPVQKVIASRLNRQISFKSTDSIGNPNCFDYTLQAIQCTPNNPNGDTPGELTAVNPAVAFYPAHFTPDNLISAPSMAYQPCRGQLSDVINLIIQPYQAALTAAATQYDDQISKYIVETDKTCRKNLDHLLNELFQKQSAEVPDFCIGLNCSCDSAEFQADYAPYSGLKTDSNVQSIVDSGSSGTTPITGVNLITTQSITASVAPILAYAPVTDISGTGGDFQGPAFELPGDRATTPPATTCQAQFTPVGPLGSAPVQTSRGCWVQYPDGAVSFVAPGSFIPPGTNLYGGDIKCGTMPPQFRTQTIPDPNDPVQFALVAQLSATYPGDTFEDIATRQEEITKIQAGYPSSKIIGELWDKWSNNLRNSLINASINYSMNAIKYSTSTNEYPPGTYAFIYEGGAFIQPHLTQGELHGLNPQDPLLSDGAFQKYWVGNESSAGSESDVEYNVFIVNPYNHASINPFNSKICSQNVGLQIGWASSSFTDGTPSNYFTPATNYNIPYMSGTGQFEAGLLNMDPNNLNINPSITWYNFPSIGINTDDPVALENSYLKAPFIQRMVLIKTTAPGFFFSRVRTAASFLNLFGSFIMPPIQNINGVNYSTNRAIIYDYNRFAAPILNARPTAVGTVQLNVAQIVTGTTIPPTPPPISNQVASPTNTVINTSPSTIPADGMTISTITIRLNDANNNGLIAGGDTVALTTTGSAILSPVIDQDNGVYTATILDSTVETVLISCTVNGTSVGFTVPVNFVYPSEATA